MPFNPENLLELAANIKTWSQALGFQQVGITNLELTDPARHLAHFLQKGYHGEMEYLNRNQSKRAIPATLQPGTIRVITARMDYLSPSVKSSHVLGDPKLGFISRYALGRDYHKVIRKRLNQLAKKITEAVGPFGYRAFCDSAPVLEKALAEKSGLGWIGKHTNLINRKAGSWFFLGEIYTDLPLPVDEQRTAHCGSCKACIEICPTKAIIAPYQLDARRCISYQTIENKGPIPVELRPLLGNCIFGCDDCQLVCPWNRYAKLTVEKDFYPRHGLDNPELIALFNWTEDAFLHYTEGSAMRRIRYEQWLRNLAVALGNAPFDTEIMTTLSERKTYPSILVQEHVQWAIAAQDKKRHGK